MKMLFKHQCTDCDHSHEYETSATLWCHICDAVMVIVSRRDKPRAR